LSPAERELAVAQGVLDPSEVDDLVRIGAEILDARQRVQAQTHAALHDMETIKDRNERWASLRTELGLHDDRDADQFILHVAQRVEQDSDGRMTLGTLPGPQWENAIRVVAAQLHDTQRAHEVRDWKQRLVDEDSGDLASGLTVGGVPARPRVVIQPRYRPAEATAAALARGRVETDDEIRASVAFGGDETNVLANIVEGGGDEAMPPSVAAKLNMKPGVRSTRRVVR